MKREGDKEHGLLHYTALAFAFILCVFVVYVLSVGPVAKAFTTIDALKPYESTAKDFYLPLRVLCEYCQPCRDFLDWYLLHLWGVN